MSFQRFTLPNGLVVVCETIPYVRSVTVGIWVKTGSKYENAGEYGLTHFLEHLLFKGTQNRSAREIAEQMDAVGGQLNAFTSKEYTCFYARVLSDHFAFAMELLSDMLQNSVFAAEDFDREKQVVLEEIKLYEDTPDELIHDLCAKSVLGDHPLGRSVLGSIESISAITREQTIAFWREHYTADNLIISVAGQVDPEIVLHETNRFFGAMTCHGTGTCCGNGTRAGCGAEAGTACEAGADVCCETGIDTGYGAGANLFKEKDTEQVHICLGSEGLSRHNEGRYAVQVLDALLGGTVSSRLFQVLREERGLVYSAFSAHSAYQELGLFSIYVGVSKPNAGEVLKLLRQELLAVRQGQISEGEVSRAKEQLRGSILFGLESTSNRMSRLAKSEMFYGEIVPADEIIARIQRVTKDDVIATARLVFARQPYISAIGQIAGLGRQWAQFQKGW